MDFKRGLKVLDRKLKDTEFYVDFVNYQQRLLGVLEDIDSYGENPATRSEINRIVAQLNKLSLEHFGSSFNDFCLGSDVVAAHREGPTHFERRRMVEIVSRINDEAVTEAIGALVDQDMDPQAHTRLTPDSVVRYLLSTTLPSDDAIFLASLIVRYELGNDPRDVSELRSNFLIPELEGRHTEKSRFVDAGFLYRGARATQSVCLIEHPQGQWQGTGFYVGNDMVLTNFHVVAACTRGEQVQVRFGVIAGNETRSSSVSDFQLVRDGWLVDSSPIRELDYALLRLERHSNPIDDDICRLPLADTAIEKGEHVYILQHPEGKPLKVVLHDNEIIYVSRRQNRVRYRALTDHGSSGAPVFNESWQVVALHHSSGAVPSRWNQGRNRFNEGVLIEAILPNIRDEIG